MIRLILAGRLWRGLFRKNQAAVERVAALQLEKAVAAFFVTLVSS
jgi:hypothetical protein